MKTILLFLITGFNLQYVFAQSLNPEVVKEHIKLVENNLAGLVKIEGHAGDNILDRMTFYNVKGLSIAVISDYKIERRGWIVLLCYL